MNPNVRRHDADWLRVFAVLLLFVFHVSKVFDVAPFYHIKNVELVPSLDLLTHFIHLWHMPLFFALAGWSLCASLKVRGTQGMLRERARRLLVPLIFGIVVICPVIKYYELRSGLSLSIRGLETGVEFHESFLAYWPTFFAGLDRFTWAHLWFIAYLLTFTMLYRRFYIARLATPASDATASVARLYRPLIALVLIQTTLRLVWPGSLNLIWDWANFAYYSLYFLMGFEVGRNPVWERSIAGQWRRSGLLGLGTCVAMVAYLNFVLGGQVVLDPSTVNLRQIVSLLPLLAMTAVAGYGLILGLVGFAMEKLRRGNLALTHLSEASLPIYILHQAGIVIPGFYLVRLELPVGVKFALLLITSVVLTGVVYHWIVRPFAPLRVAFGMAHRRRREARAGKQSLSASLSRSLCAVMCVASAVLLPAPLAHAEGAGAVGLWWADGGSAQVDVREKDGELTGTIVWLRAPFDLEGHSLRDVHHPDASRHDEPVIGLDMLRGFHADSHNAGTWIGGSVYDPGNGSTYRGTIRMDGPDRLLLRGFIGISLFGRTTAWIRVGSEDVPPRDPYASQPEDQRR